MMKHLTCEPVIISARGGLKHLPTFIGLQMLVERIAALLLARLGLALTSGRDLPVHLGPFL